MESKNTFRTLKSTKDFQNLFEKGKKIHLSSWLVVNVGQNPLEFSRFGWTLPRYVGSAVTRNKLKRWCREFLRSKPTLIAEKIDVNFVFRRRDKEFYKSLNHEEFIHAVSKLALKLNLK